MFSMVSSTTQAYLDFLRYSLSDTVPYPASLATMDWDGLLEFADKQAIVGVLFHGLNRLSTKAPRPDKIRIFKWYSKAQELHDINERVNKECCILLRILAEDGIKGCILKGQGNATMYPDPYMRTPGDIDVWTDMPSAVELIKYVRSREPSAGIEYHHIDCHIFEHTPVELHYFPSFMGNLFYEWRLRRYFNRCKAEQFAHHIAVPGIKGQQWCVPTVTFNVVFQLSHIMHHFFFEGIGLRQMIDYFYLLRKGLSEAEKVRLVKDLEYLHLLRFAQGIMWVLHHILGLEERFLYTAPDEKIGRMLLTEILEAGNFGFYDHRYHFSGLSLLQQYVLEVYRNLHYAWLFPSEAIWGRPLSRFWHTAYKAWLRWRVKG